MTIIISYNNKKPYYYCFINGVHIGTYKSLWQAYKARAKREFELFGEYSSISC
jgi:hypothetical protein